MIFDAWKLKISMSPIQCLPYRKNKGGDIGFGLRTKNQGHCRQAPKDTPETLGDIGRHSIAVDPLTTTCNEEREALKDAPPWAGFWLDPPTLKQRIKAWTDYARHKLRKLTHD